MDEQEFDILRLLDRVPVLVRVLQLICSVVVASSLLGNIAVVPGLALDFCNYGIALGFLSTAFGLLAIGGAIYSHRVPEGPALKKLVAAELVMNIIFSIMWLAAFITLTVKWVQLDSPIPSYSMIGWIGSNFCAAISFAFFAFLFQIILTFLSFLGALATFSSSPFIPMEYEETSISFSSNESLQTHLTFSKFYLKFTLPRDTPISDQQTDGSNYETISVR